MNGESNGPLLRQTRCHRDDERFRPIKGRTPKINLLYDDFFAYDCYCSNSFVSVTVLPQLSTRRATASTCIFNSFWFYRQKKSYHFLIPFHSREVEVNIVVFFSTISGRVVLLPLQAQPEITKRFTPGTYPCRKKWYASTPDNSENVMNKHVGEVHNCSYWGTVRNLEHSRPTPTYIQQSWFLLGGNNKSGAFWG